MDYNNRLGRGLDKSVPPPSGVVAYVPVMFVFLGCNIVPRNSDLADRKLVVTELSENNGDAMVFGPISKLLKETTFHRKDWSRLRHN